MIRISSTIETESPDSRDGRCANCGHKTCPMWCRDAKPIRQWSDAAACAHIEPNPFDHDGVYATREQKRICSTCPVRIDCLEFALTNRIDDDVWGGHTPRERKSERFHLLELLRKRRAHEHELGGAE